MVLSNSNLRFKGFTLIELLIVFAILAILIAIVLTSITSARKKAQDEAIRQMIDQMRTVALIYRDNNGNYGYPTDGINCSSGMFSDPEVARVIQGAQDLATDSQDPSNPVLCISTSSVNAAYANTWSISVRLKSDLQKAWCVDNTGVIKFGHASLDGITNSAVCGQ